MKKLLVALPIALLAIFLTAGFSSGFSPSLMRSASLVIIIVLAAIMLVLRKQNNASPIAWAMAAFWPWAS